jgi:bifunctional UDP-N-acetylglucosamine pyrophosphorylase/glucosamine-1-phosphate N-acetyltransferase
MPLTTVILAGGDGKRMRSDLPKVLHLVGGKPMLVRVIESVREVHPDKIVVVTGRYHSLIIQTLGTWMDIFGIVFVEQSPALGTGHAVQCCLNHIGMNDRILILNGDMPLIRPNILHILIKNGRMNMVMTTKLDNPTGYGRVIYDSRGEFRAIKEERDCEEDDRQIQEVNTGVYIFSGQVLHECLPLLTNDNSQKEYYLTDVVRHALTAGYIIHTFMTMDSISVLGANTPEELAELSRILESRS